MPARTREDPLERRDPFLRRRTRTERLVQKRIRPLRRSGLVRPKINNLRGAPRKIPTGDLQTKYGTEYARSSSSTAPLGGCIPRRLSQRNSELSGWIGRTDFANRIPCYSRELTPAGFIVLRGLEFSALRVPSSGREPFPRESSLLFRDFTGREYGE